jgi:hypothetical protein
MPPEPPTSAPAFQAGATPSEPPKYIPWEDMKNLGFFKALWETWKESTFYPNEFFSKTPTRGGIWPPLFYALLVIWVSNAISQVMGLIFSNFSLGIMADIFDNEELIEAMSIFGAMGAVQLILTLLILPFLIAAGLFIASGIFHLIIMLFGWSKRDFEATFRAVAYSAGPMIFTIVPACGSIVAYIWSIILIIFGIKHLQKTTSGQASLVVLLPLILCCCFIGMMMAIFGTMLLGFIREAMSGGYYYD